MSKQLSLYLLLRSREKWWMFYMMLLLLSSFPWISQSDSNDAHWDALGLSMYMTQLYFLKNSWLQKSQLVYMEITCRRGAFSFSMNRRNRNKICLHRVKITILGDICSLFEQVHYWYKTFYRVLLCKNLVCCDFILYFI